MLLNQVSGEFQARRHALMQSHAHTAVILPGAVELTRNASTTFPFRQDSSFYYLTGFEEPDAILVLVPWVGSPSKTRRFRSVAFVRKRDAEREIWEGEHYGVERVREIFGFDETYPIDEFESRLAGLLSDSEKVFYALNQPRGLDRVVLPAIEKATKARMRSSHLPMSIHHPATLVGEMRLLKSLSEIENMRRAAQISAETHTEVMKVVRPGMTEFDVETMLEYGFKRRGCKRSAYDSIVAGGKNATCLHYRFNNEELRDGDLLLIDAAGEIGLYAADITRTYPVGKKFTPVQARVYDIVLRAQKAGIELAKPGSTIEDVHRQCVDVLVDGLIELGLLKGKRTDLVQSGAYRRFYMHNTSHWLGLDVHDSGAYREASGSRKLLAGSVITVEPGLYMQHEDQTIPAEYRGIGIRIEDDVLITESGNEVMSRAAPKEREEVEALRA